MSQQGVKNTEYFSGQGVVMVGSRDATTGQPVGLRPVGTVRDLKLDVSSSEITEKETQTGARGVELVLVTEVAVNLSANLKSLDSKNMALAMQGLDTDVSAGVVVDLSLTVSGDLYLPLGYVNVSAVVVTDNTGATTFTEGTDYAIDDQSGLINRIEGGTLADNTEILVDFSYADQTNIDASTATSSDMWVRFNGLNTADGDKPVVIDFFRVSSKPLKSLSLITDDTASLELDMSVLYDSKRTSGSNYYRILKA